MAAQGRPPTLAVIVCPSCRTKRSLRSAEQPPKFCHNCNKPYHATGSVTYYGKRKHGSISTVETTVRPVFGDNEVSMRAADATGELNPSVMNDCEDGQGGFVHREELSSR